MRSEDDASDRHGLVAFGDDGPGENQAYGLVSCLVCLVLLGFVLGFIVGFMLMAVL